MLNNLISVRANLKHNLFYLKIQRKELVQNQTFIVTLVIFLWVMSRPIIGWSIEHILSYHTKSFISLSSRQITTELQTSKWSELRAIWPATSVSILQKSMKHVIGSPRYIPEISWLFHTISKRLKQAVFFDYNKILSAVRAITFHRRAYLPKLCCLLALH